MHELKMTMRALLSATLLLAAACGDDTGGAGGAGGGDGQGGGAGTTTSTGSGVECGNGGGEAPVGPCLVVAHAGTYQVTPTVGSHTRGTITLGEDGSVDYDTGLFFDVASYEGVYDRLECCQRVSVEMRQTPENDTSLAPDARHRVDFFTDSTAIGGAVVRFEYFPNYPSEEGKVELDVVE